MEPRLASRLLAAALLRLAERDGGFGAVLAKGDPESGAVTLVLAERGERRMILERAAGMGGASWVRIGERAAGNDSEFEKFLANRRRIDPDMWLIELDVPSAERFADELERIG